MTSKEARTQLVDTLELDLIGPDNDHECAHELLPESPYRWYLTGYLMAAEGVHRGFDEEAREEQQADAVHQNPASADDDNQPVDSNSKRSLLPSSMGISVMVGSEAETLSVVAQWGDYYWESEEEEGSDAPGEEEEAEGEEEKKSIKGYRRESREERVLIPLDDLSDGEAVEYDLPNSRNLKITAVCSPLGETSYLGLPAGAKTVSVFLSNYRECSPRFVYKACAFQAKLILESKHSFLNQPDLRGLSSEENQSWDEKLNDLQYRNVRE